MPGSDGKRPQWLALAGLGFELAAAVVGFALLGYWIDRHYETEPWGLLVCIGIGLFGGMYNFIRQSVRASRSSADEEGSDGDKTA